MTNCLLKIFAYPNNRNTSISNEHKIILSINNNFISDTIKIYYIGEFGYYWIFPRNPEKKEVNVGIGFVKNFDYNLKNLLEEFEKNQNKCINCGIKEECYNQTKVNSLLKNKKTTTKKATTPALPQGDIFFLSIFE